MRAVALASGVRPRALALQFLSGVGDGVGAGVGCAVGLGVGAGVAWVGSVV